MPENHSIEIHSLSVAIEQGLPTIYTVSCRDSISNPDATPDMHEYCYLRLHDGTCFVEWYENGCIVRCEDAQPCYNRLMV